jgi:hypothetical protein
MPILMSEPIALSGTMTLADGERQEKPRGNVRSSTNKKKRAALSPQKVMRFATVRPADQSGLILVVMG